MKIINKTKNTFLAGEVALADTPFKRIKGLLGRKEFRHGQALIIKPCNSIHTFFMRFSIDVLFLDNDNKVVATISCLKPFRFSPIYFNANLTVELPAGTIERTFTEKGDTIQL